MKRLHEALLVISLVAGLPGNARLLAAPDDEDAVAPALVDETVEQIGEVAVQPAGDDGLLGLVGIDGSGARERFKVQLALRLDDLMRTCQLTAAQQEKVRLAAGVDDRRFFSAAESLGQRMLQAHDDQRAMQAIWPDVTQLQERLIGGMYGDKSFCGKSLHAVLSPEQEKQRTELAAERARMRYRTGLESVLTRMDDAVGFSDEQYTAIVQLVLNETSPPESGLYDTATVMEQIKKVPAGKLQAVLGERQWKRLSARLAAPAPPAVPAILPGGGGGPPF